MTPVRVLIVDDHPVVHDGLRGMLQAQPDLDVVADAANGHQALAAVARHVPGVVLMDLRMPELDGVQATRRIRAEHPGVRVLVLTTYDTDTDILHTIEAGATGYLLKDAPARPSSRPCAPRPAAKPCSPPRSPPNSYTASVAPTASSSPTANSTCYASSPRA